MSNHDQCPTSHKQGKPVHEVPPGALDVASTRAEAVGAVAGRKYWRGLEDAADSREFRDWMEREFPAGASELDAGGETRRSFLKLMGAGLALAGAATMPACRRPEHNILPYSARVPEDVIPGKPLFYATSMPLPMGGAEGLLAETHEGRPTKLEGNPLHAVNQGKSSLWSQASILSLYDPDRLKSPELVRSAAGAEKEKIVEATWDDFAAWSKGHFAGLDADGGAGLALLMDKGGGPAREAMKAAVKKRWPKAQWVAYDALEDAAKAAALSAACGAGAREVLDLSKARVILSLDRDALNLEAGSLVAARQFAAGRAVMKTADEMNRLYAAESGFTSTGAMADHRLRLRPSQISALLVAVAEKLSTSDRPLAQGVSSVKDKFKLGGAEAGFEPAWVEAVCEDLLAAKGNSAVLVGPGQPAWAHALGMLVNAALGNVGKSVRYVTAFGDAGSDGIKALGELIKAMDAGLIKTIVCLNVNPYFNVPGFAERFAKVGTRVTLSNDLDETSSMSTWRLNAATYLEAWGDTVAFDGTVAPIQPMIAPLYGGKSEVETLAIITGEKVTDGYEIVRNAWRAAVKAPDFEKAWRRALFDGVLAGVNLAGAAASFNLGRAAEMVTTATPFGGELEVVFLATPLHDGRWANNAWLNELPDAVARVVWDNPAMISPGTAKKLGLTAQDYTAKKPSGELIELTLQSAVVGTGGGPVGATLKIAAWVVPGIADGVVVLPLGLGRRVTGLVGTGVGFDTFAFKPLGGFTGTAGLERLGDRYEVSSTQLHGTMEGRAIVREMDLAAYRKHGGGPIETLKDAYGRSAKLSLAERLEGSEMTHMPALVSAYENPYNASKGDVNLTPSHPPYDPRRAGKQGGFDGKPAFAVGPQWGMSIDLSSCIGCNVCTIACQAENNIPVVGKIEVNKGREMHWIRVDRYFTGAGDASEPDGMVYQPVACVHCENAPCEVVCPVNATVHGPEGHNYMIYNRCIGTRYCANNCPYKVRRFNFFEYGVTKFNGGLEDGIRENTPEFVSEHLPENQALIPPRLRKKLDEIARLQKNPNVTVRSRGVMEKCTYCIQRTNEAKIELKIKGERKNGETIPDGYVQTACQQACPTGAIAFGDILDKTSRVHEAREHHRTYALLGYLNVRPRTTYMARVNNPNPKLRAQVADPFEHGGGHEGEDGLKGGQEGKGGAGGKGHTFFDRSKLHGEDGYRLSLSVLGGQA